MIHVTINPELIRWARERAGRSVQDLAVAFPKLDRWERNEEQPTLKQIERFAMAVHAPIGFLFLPHPPVESVPIPDFRMPCNVHKLRPSPDLLDTIYICQQRQEWYRDYSLSLGEKPLAFVGSSTIKSPILSVADTIRHELGFDVDQRRDMYTWTDALRHFITQADELGILVMCSGVVFNNTHRHLDPEEFRGFAMADPLAPLVFINGADTKAAQMFTLAHELAHIWLGQSAISDGQALILPDNDIENWCNQVAAELLVPLDVVRTEYDGTAELNEESTRLARRFKVSSLVILRRIYDTGAISREELWQAYENELARLRAIPRGSGGDFYLTQAARVSKRFARALVISTLEGHTLHRDAFRMLGFSKLETFHELGRNLGVIG
jgi:Zn-dependent peptidase ImmA (M78 family)